ncbi:Hypothetical predicted protein [Paramuricea clavata]|uniref:Uncharacterized protein n=1 Tax=Paramuricea clavata TaxID=317549 RepID=A0A7D9ES65_PARCT|nr:Hypothetical predicted protein [Paramuricea clavata]
MLPLDITLVYFSGRPDPHWQVQANHPKYQKIREMFNSAVNQELAALPEQMPSQLGYRGFLVRDSNDQLPKLILGTTTKELQLLLLGTIPSDAIPQALVGIIAKTIEDGGVSPIGAESETPGTKRAPKYNVLTQWKWNNWFVVTKNNCYNYATNKRTSTNAQPGRKHGVNVKNNFSEDFGKEVMKAAVKDGLTVVGNFETRLNIDVPTRKSLELLPSQHLVALFASNSGK